jgi:hypothetical protein
MLSCTSETGRDTKGITFFFFLEALKKGLASSCRIGIGLASIGIGVSSSSGIEAI